MRYLACIFGCHTWNISWFARTNTELKRGRTCVRCGKRETYRLVEEWVAVEEEK